MAGRGKAIRETIGFLGVVSSMVFVGMEIRQNTNAVRGATMQGIAEMSFQYNVELVQDDDWMRIMSALRSGVTRDQLSAVDQERQHWAMTASTRIMENRYRQSQLGILDESGVGLLGGTTNASWYGSPYFREWWYSTDPSTRHAPDFVAFMEQEVMARGN